MGNLEQVDHSFGSKRPERSTRVLELVGRGQSGRHASLAYHLVMLDVDRRVPVIEAYEEVGSTHGVQVGSRDATTEDERYTCPEQHGGDRFAAMRTHRWIDDNRRGPVKDAVCGRDHRPCREPLEDVSDDGLFPTATLCNSAFHDRAGGSGGIVESAVMDPSRTSPEFSTTDQDRSSVRRRRSHEPHDGIAVGQEPNRGVAILSVAAF